MRWILCAPPDHATSQPHRTAGSTGPEPEVEVTHQLNEGGMDVPNPAGDVPRHENHIAVQCDAWRWLIPGCTRTLRSGRHRWGCTTPPYVTSPVMGSFCARIERGQARVKSRRLYPKIAAT